MFKGFYITPKKNHRISTKKKKKSHGRNYFLLKLQKTDIRQFERLPTWLVLLLKGLTKVCNQFGKNFLGVSRFQCILLIHNDAWTIQVVLFLVRSKQNLHKCYVYIQCWVTHMLHAVSYRVCVGVDRAIPIYFC